MGRKQDKIQLDDRLRVAANMIRPGSVVADIGTDHAFLPCALILEGTSPLAWAADINEQPLDRARATIRRWGLEDQVHTVLSDGLTELEGKRIDDFVLAGMGGELITSLLLAVPWTRDPNLSFVLQPMTRHQHLRRALYRNGFAIAEERAVVSGRFAYTLMRACYTGECREIPSQLAWTGVIWDNNDSASRSYLLRVANQLEKKLRGFKGQPEEQELRSLLQRIQERVR